MSQDNGYTPEKFPKPRTIPGAWDFAGLQSAFEETAGQPSLGTRKMDTFPKTTTMPEKWDLTHLMNQ
jgi:hypothetical protein